MRLLFLLPVCHACVCEHGRLHLLVAGILWLTNHMANGCRPHTRAPQRCNELRCACMIRTRTRKPGLNEATAAHVQQQEGQVLAQERAHVH